MRTKVLGVIVVCAMAVVAATSGSSQATAPESGYYKGKTVIIIAPFAPGGPMDQYARLFAPYIGKYLGAAQVRVEDVQGAGSVIGLNQLWSSPSDGLTIGYGNVDVIVLSSMLRAPGVTYDYTKMVWLGNTATQLRVLVVGKKSGIKTLDQLKAAKPFKVASEGFDDDFYTLSVLAAQLPMDVKFITGYSSQAHVYQSIVTGETDGTTTGFDNAKSLLESGDFVPVLAIGDEPLPGYPNLPLWTNVVGGSGKNVAKAMTSIVASMSRTFFGPPNMNPTAVKLMRDAVRKAMQDPDLRARAAKAHFPLQFMSGADEDALVRNIALSGPTLVPTLQKAAASISSK